MKKKILKKIEKKFEEKKWKKKIRKKNWKKLRNTHKNSPFQLLSALLIMCNQMIDHNNWYGEYGKSTEHDAIHIIVLYDTIQCALYANIIFI